MTASPETNRTKRSTFICSRGTLDGAYPSLILAINARRLGHESHVFYTFMGIEVVRKGKAEKLKFYPDGPMGAIPGVPCLATAMMQKNIDGAHIPNVAELIETAQAEGVRLIACKMTIDMMRLDENELIEDLEIMNAEQYLKLAETCAINMFT